MAAGAADDGVDTGTLYRYSESSGFMPRAVLFDVRGATPLGVLTGEDDGASSTASWATACRQRFSRRSLQEVDTDGSVSENGLSCFSDGVSAFTSNTERRDELEDAARWFLEDTDCLDVS
jgi:hypothetical protein